MPRAPSPGSSPRWLDGRVSLSIVIPTRNGMPHLEPQLAAIREQMDDIDNVEVIVVDNGSSDGTGELVARLSEQDPRIRCVRTLDDFSVAHARNVGSRHAQYENIAICDADDLVAEGWVRAMAAALDKHPFVTGPVELDSLNPPWVVATRGRADTEPDPTFFGIFPKALGCNLGVRRPLLDQLGGFDTDLRSCEDLDFSMRAWLAGSPCTWVPDAVVHYRYRTESLALFKQGFAYGSVRPLICRRLAGNGARTPGRFAGWRSWLWLVIALPRVLSRSGRAAVAWGAGNRIGQVVGSMRHRSLYL